MKSQTTTSVLSVQKPTLRRASFYIGAPVLFRLCTAKEQFFAPKTRRLIISGVWSPLALFSKKTVFCFRNAIITYCIECVKRCSCKLLYLSQIYTINCVKLRFLLLKLQELNTGGYNSRKKERDAQNAAPFLI